MNMMKCISQLQSQLFGSRVREGYRRPLPTRAPRISQEYWAILCIHNLNSALWRDVVMNLQGHHRWSELFLSILWRRVLKAH